MRARYWLLVVPMLLVSASLAAQPTPIPAFTPNVVDPSGVLDADANARVNAEIQRIRDASRIWGAVYIVDTLAGEPIEDLAVRAFEHWKLGQAGVDNGLLLVLAIQDRRSRFEVGYGLEGTITDVAALHALDTYLAPRMRAGDTAGAIVDAFGYLSRLVEQDPAAIEELATVSEPVEDWARGLRAWGLFLIPVWFGAPFYRWWLATRRRRLLEAHPALALKGDEVIANADAADGRSSVDWGGRIGIGLFLTVNPGLFVFFLAALEKAVFYVSLVLPGALVLLVSWIAGRKYGSPDRYERHLQNVAQRRADLVGRGHLVRNAAGTYSYTPAYHASRRSSSSSSSSSRRSSSGGGRSGGGGASSSW